MYWLDIAVPKLYTFFGNNEIILVIFSVLDDKNAVRPPSSETDLLNTKFSNSIPGELTSRRHLKAFKQSGLLNFAAVNNSAAGLDVISGREFCRR